MPEQTPITKPKKISYNGLFSFKEVHEIILKHWDDLGYDKIDIKHEIKVLKTKTQYDLWNSFEYEYTDQEAVNIFQIINGESQKKVEVKINGEKRTLDQGTFFIQFTGRLRTDIDDIWRSKGIYHILSYFANTYIFKKHLTQIKKKGMNDCDVLYEKLLRYFNTYRDYD